MYILSSSTIVTIASSHTSSIMIAGSSEVSEMLKVSSPSKTLSSCILKHSHSQREVRSSGLNVTSYVVLGKSTVSIESKKSSVQSNSW